MTSSKKYALLKFAVCAGVGAGAASAFWTIRSSNAEYQPLRITYETPMVAGAAPQEPVTKRYRFDSAIRACRDLALRAKEEFGIPGLCIAVNVDGQSVWAEGFGYSDVENGVPCTPESVMRVASISKSITMTALAKLWEEGKVDLDKPVQEYVSTFPKKSFNGEHVEITTRMLTCHLSGIRHWKDNDRTDAPVVDSKEEWGEFYLNERFRTVESALEIFRDDDLEHKPGTKFLYSTPAWTLISVVMEKAAGTTFAKIMSNLFRDLGLSHTTLDENEFITYNRSRYYTRNKHGRLINAPCVDNSCKWAGGGLQSTVGDLTKFGDAMLHCLQSTDTQMPPGYLKKETIEFLWTVVPNTVENTPGISGYGMGWVVVPKQKRFGGVQEQSLTVGHTGAAVGASSALFILPYDSPFPQLPSGITVAITANLQGVGFSLLARNILKLFDKARNEASYTSEV